MSNLAENKLDLIDNSIKDIGDLLDDGLIITNRSGFIVSANDVLVELFLQKKIKFLDIQKKLFAVIRMKEFVKYKSIQPRNYQDVIKLSNYVRLKIFEKVYKSQNVNS